MGMDANTMKMVTQVANIAQVGATAYSTVQGVKHNKKIAQLEQESLAIEKEAEAQKLAFQEQDLKEEAARSRKSLMAAAAASGLMPSTVGSSTDALIKKGGRNLQRDIARLDSRRSLLNQGLRLKQESAKTRYSKASSELLASGFGSIFSDVSSMFVPNKQGQTLFDGGFFAEKKK